MIKNYKTFLNVILSLSLILIPSYGYPQANDSKGSKISGVEDFISSLQMQYSPDSEIQEPLLILKGIGEAISKGTIKDYVYNNEKFNSYLDTIFTMPNMRETFRDLLIEMGEASQQGEFKNYLKENTEFRYYLEGIISHRPGFEKAFTSFMTIEETIEQGSFTDFVDQHLGILAYFNSQSAQELELELKEALPTLKEIGRSIELDKEVLVGLSEKTSEPLKPVYVLGALLVLSLGAGAGGYTPVVLAQDFDNSIDNLFLTSVVIAIGIYVSSLISNPTFSTIWNRLKHKISSPYYQLNKEMFIQTDITDKEPVKMKKTKGLFHKGWLAGEKFFLLAAFLNVAFMYLFYIEDFGELSKPLMEGLLAVGVVVTGLSYRNVIKQTLSKNWTWLKNKIPSSIQPQSVAIEGVATEMESQPPGLLKRAWDGTRNACAGLFTKSNNKKDNDTSS